MKRQKFDTKTNFIQVQPYMNPDLFIFLEPKASSFCMAHMRNLPYFTKIERSAMLVAMKKSVLVTILSVLLILTVSCGKAEPEPDLTLSTYSPELPASFEVVSSELSDDTAVVRLRQDENEFDVVLDDDVNIYFDSSIVSKTLIKTGQTVYISGPDARNLETVIISDWPGIITEDAQMVKTEQASVTEVLGFFLEENHPELEIMADSVWVLDESSSQHVDESHLEFYMFDRHMLVMRWRDHDFPDYNLMLVPDHDGSAYWSGRLNEYGEIEEYYYEK